MNFGDALTELRRGNNVTRKDWGNKDIYVYLESISSEIPIGEDESREFLMIRTLFNVFKSFKLNQKDILSDDWIVVKK